jgi:hypothetical protein
MGRRRLCRMTEPGDEAAKARSLGLALLDASRTYEGLVIPSFEGRLRRRPFPPHRRAIIGLVGRQRRFLRAAYTLADAGQMLEAVGPLRSMLEFLICQRWLAYDDIAESLRLGRGELQGALSGFSRWIRKNWGDDDGWPMTVTYGDAQKGSQASESYYLVTPTTATRWQAVRDRSARNDR